jgi:hypothetical protein
MRTETQLVILLIILAILPFIWPILESILDPAAAGSEEKCEETAQAGGDASKK